jgi:hypothetical protein
VDARHEVLRLPEGPRRCPRLEAVPAPAAEYATATDAFGAALANEQAVTQSIHQIYGLAVEEKDFASQSFLNWFVTEQVEEENTVKGILGWLKRIGESGQGLFLFDRGLAQTRRPRTSADLDTSAWAWSPPTAMHASERLLRASSSLC